MYREITICSAREITVPATPEKTPEMKLVRKYQKMKDGGSGVSGVSAGAFTPAAAASAGMEPFATGMAADLSASGGGFDVSV